MKSSATFSMGIIGLAVVIAGIIVAPRVMANSDPSRQPVTYARQVLVWIDPDTGCHYLTRDGYITPRLSGDGKQLCIL